MVTYPSDWEISQIDKIADITTGCRDVKDSVKNGKYPFYVRSKDVERINFYDFDCEAVLTAGDGGAGKIFHYKNGKFAAHQRVYVISKFEKVDGKYFYYFFSKNFLQEVEKYTAKSTVDSVRRPMIANMEFPLPPFKEQQAIASALSDFDEHIDNLSELIEKKKAIREGALEDLLSGRTRLDGFDGEWIESTIEDSTKEIITGGTPSTTVDKYWGGSIPWLASTEIHQKIITRATKNITKIGLDNSSAKMAPKDSVLIALAGQGKTRGTAAFLAYPMALNQSLAALVAADETDSKFLYYLIENMYLELRELSSGDGGRGGLNKTLIKNINIRLPREIKEQHAIAEVLTAMDEEIESLKIEKEKMIQIKEGAMDDLLIGRVRLKV
ncbi:restriction endonuclease subunit S [Enterococcus lactis]|uniref:restriction endonuclease subunit S n=1 Tax=Enterococcus TaxID=1350 RepID=UPI0022E07787|nr:restriction endonuclease subunit S [Enterococcus lactis]